MIGPLSFGLLMPRHDHEITASTAASVALSASSGAAGANVTLSGKGFAKSQGGQVFRNGNPAGMPSVQTGKNGALSARFAVPLVSPGAYSVSFTVLGQTAAAPFKVVAATMPSPSPTLAPSPSPTLTPSPSPTLTPAPSPSITPAPSPTLTPAPSGSRRVVGYFPLWLRSSGYTEREIDFSIVTTVAHFAVVPRADGSIEIPDWGPFPDSALITAAHTAGASVVLVVGGDHAAATTGFAGMAASPTARKTFVRNLLALVTTYGYDGVDLDWEYPKTGDKANLTALVSKLRAALGTQRTLSVAGPYLDWDGGYDLPALVPNLDWIGAMTYGLHAASWADHTGHAAALYAGSGTLHADEFTVDASRRWYLSNGVPAGKLLIGLPFWGERFDGATGINQHLSSNQGGAMDYREIAGLVSNGWTANRDPLAQVPFLVRSGAPGVISYDDPTSIAAKCNYVGSQALGGAIVWHLGKDRLPSGQPLLSAARGCR